MAKNQLLEKAKEMYKSVTNFGQQDDDASKDVKTIFDLSDNELALLIQNRWDDGEEVWSEVQKWTKRNKDAYKGDPEYLERIPKRKPRITANRIFVDQEAVINSVIATPPKPNVLPNNNNPMVKEMALSQERYFNTIYNDLNTKEKLRRGLRHLYFSRMIALKPFWNPKINNVDVKVLDPNKIRVSKKSTKEEESSFFIEQLSDNLTSLVKMFPDQKDYLWKAAGIKSQADMLIRDPELEYYEAWIDDYLCWKHQNKILKKMRNPYWDWVGLLVTEDEQRQLNGTDKDTPPVVGDARRRLMYDIKVAQPQRKADYEAQKQQPQPDPQQPPQPDQNGQVQPQQAPQMPVPDGQPQPSDAQAQALDAEGKQMGAPQNLQADSSFNNIPVTFQQYYYNYWDFPRKPVIYATVFGTDDSPFGITDRIKLSYMLQESIDRRKMDIADNCDLVNGVLKIDKKVMTKEEAQKVRTETSGVIWGKGVVAGVVRETGEPLPAMVFQDMQDSRSEIDNIMAATSAFRGERQGDETKGGRIALVEQSYLSLNETVQVVDYVCQELFGWWFQLSKLKCTEYHYAKTLGQDSALQIMNLIQDDFIDGSQVKIIPGKMLPEDRVSKIQQYQQDLEAGIIAPDDYMQEAGYEDPKGKLKNAIEFKTDPLSYVGIEKPPTPPQPMKLPSETLNYKDAPPDIQRQIEQQAGLHPSQMGHLQPSQADIQQQQVQAAQQQQQALQQQNQSQPTGQGQP